jgi:hypothetical protein
LEGIASSSWATEIAPSEIAAVARGRKPVFHEHFGPDYARWLDTAADGLRPLLPGLRVESFDGHLLVVDPETAAVIAESDAVESIMEQVREAAVSDRIGEYLGYGLANRDDPSAD